MTDLLMLLRGCPHLLPGPTLELAALWLQEHRGPRTEPCPLCKEHHMPEGESKLPTVQQAYDDMPSEGGVVGPWRDRPLYSEPHHVKPRPIVTEAMVEAALARFGKPSPVPGDVNGPEYLRNETRGMIEAALGEYERGAGTEDLAVWFNDDGSVKAMRGSGTTLVEINDDGEVCVFKRRARRRG